MQFGNALARLACTSKERRVQIWPFISFTYFLMRKTIFAPLSKVTTKNAIKVSMKAVPMKS